MRFDTIVTISLATRCQCGKRQKMTGIASFFPPRPRGAAMSSIRHAEATRNLYRHVCRADQFLPFPFLDSLYTLEGVNVYNW